MCLCVVMYFMSCILLRWSGRLVLSLLINWLIEVSRYKRTPLVMHQPRVLVSQCWLVESGWGQLKRRSAPSGSCGSGRTLRVNCQLAAAEFCCFRAISSFSTAESAVAPLLSVPYVWKIHSYLSSKNGNCRKWELVYGKTGKRAQRFVM